jgi:hypothetical protein
MSFHVVCFYSIFCLYVILSSPLAQPVRIGICGAVFTHYNTGGDALLRFFAPAPARTAKPSPEVTALAAVLRRQPGRNPSDNDDTTRHLSGRSVRVLAFGLACVS